MWAMVRIFIFIQRPLEFGVGQKSDPNYVFKGAFKKKKKNQNKNEKLKKNLQLLSHIKADFLSI